MSKIPRNGIVEGRGWGVETWMLTIILFLNMQNYLLYSPDITLPDVFSWFVLCSAWYSVCGTS